MSFAKWIAVHMCLLSASVAAAATLVDESHVVASNANSLASIPVAKSFTVNTAGDYAVVLTDVGKQSGGATAFTSLSLAITQGSQLVELVSVPEATASAMSATVTLAAGNYSAQVLGVTSGASVYSATVANSNATVLTAVSDITVASSSANNDFSSLNTDINLIAGHSYSVTLHDLAFPAPMSSLMSTIVIDGGSTQCSLSASSAGPCGFTAGTTNTLIAVASKSTTAVAGMYGITIVDDVTNAVILDSTYPVGTLPAPVSITLPDTGAYTFTSTDLQIPDPLNNLQLMLLQDTNVLVLQSAAGGSHTDSFNGKTGAAKLYVVTTSTSNGGIYGVQIKQGNTPVYSNASVVAADAAVTQTGYYFNITLPAAGNYSLKLSDFNFPQSFTTLSASVTQNGSKLASINSAGTLAINNAAAGEVQVFVVATPGGAGQGLFALTFSGSTSTLLDITQGVGGTFYSIPVTISNAGSYKLNVTDLIAPQKLGQLLVVVTRDTQLVGEILGSGSINIDTTVGNYILNVIATTDAASNAPFGMYGINLAPVPTLSLTAGTTAVSSGGNVTLTWSSTDATTCTASDAWSGSKATSGSESVGPVNGDTKLTLTCTGLGGAVSQSVNVQIVTVTAQSSRSGGGMLSWWLLSGLLVLAGLSRNSRHRNF